MPATSRVPERTSRSWPPPCSSGVHATSRPSSSAPTPAGPPSLCPVTVSAATPLAAKSTGTWPTAWIASVWNGTPCSAATRGQLGDRLDRADLVVGPHRGDHGDLVAVRGPARRAARPGRPGRPRRPAASSTSAPSCSAEPVAPRRARRGARPRWRPPGCRRGSAARRAQKMPLTARLSLSVPPPVKITSDGRAPSAAATRSRDSSTRRRARRPGGVQRRRVADLAGGRDVRLERLGEHRRGRRVIQVGHRRSPSLSPSADAVHRSRPGGRGRSARRTIDGPADVTAGPLRARSAVTCACGSPRRPAGRP